MVKPPTNLGTAHASPFDMTSVLRNGLHVPRNPAEKAVDRLGEEIASFEAGLSNEQEVGGIIIGAPGNTTFHIVKFYSLNMDILVFEGLNEHGKPQRLVQHVTQLRTRFGSHEAGSSLRFG